MSLRTSLASLVVLLSAPALAGEQLSLADLVKRADAIAVVEVVLGSKKVPDRVQVKEWLRGEVAGVDAAAWVGLCLPGRRQLEDWGRRYPKHSGREAWKRLLKAGRGEQVVFLVAKDGVLRPTCETEVLLGRSLGTHADYVAFRRQLASLLTPPPTP